MVDHNGKGPTPKEEADALVKSIMRDRNVKDTLREMVESLVTSYRKGHRGFDKQIAYNELNRLTKRLDMNAVVVFNDLVYRQRR